MTYIIHYLHTYIVLKIYYCMKPICDWCVEEEYHIGILIKEDEEEFVCKTCFKKFIKKNTDSSSVPGNEMVTDS